MSPVAISHSAPETEPQQLGFNFLTQTHSAPRVSRTHDPTTTTTSYTLPSHPYATSPVAVLHAQTPSPGSRLPTQRPTTTTITSSAPPHHLPPLLSILISDGTPEIELQWLGFGFLALN
ncbi:hypothetical protein PILCRDRAFT_17072 [Piloderma croceum F 1598]|uniref:Uncharacterized protein n=1 Tax=Piloderma croceum (strain F 1598) TaxID=765440 RepID=A0A0C3EUC9_PILCF|nr:hypothetical protein PILCRDRAFT_17072 [Piloderma croceum F 1598]